MDKMVVHNIGNVASMCLESSKFYKDDEKFLKNFLWLHVGLKNFYSDDDGVPWS